MEPLLGVHERPGGPHQIYFKLPGSEPTVETKFLEKHLQDQRNCFWLTRKLEKHMGGPESRDVAAKP